MLCTAKGQNTKVGWGGK